MRQQINQPVYWLDRMRVAIGRVVLLVPNPRVLWVGPKAMDSYYAEKTVRCYKLLLQG